MSILNIKKLGFLDWVAGGLVMVGAKAEAQENAYTTVATVST